MKIILDDTVFDKKENLKNPKKVLKLDILAGSYIFSCPKEAV